MLAGFYSFGPTIPSGRFYSIYTSSLSLGLNKKQQPGSPKASAQVSRQAVSLRQC